MDDRTCTFVHKNGRDASLSIKLPILYAVEVKTPGSLVNWGSHLDKVHTKGTDLESVFI